MLLPVNCFSHLSPHMLCFVALFTLKDLSQWSLFEHHNVLNNYKYCEQTLFDFSLIFFPIQLHKHHL